MATSALLTLTANSTAQIDVTVRDEDGSLLSFGTQPTKAQLIIVEDPTGLLGSTSAQRFTLTGGTIVTNGVVSFTGVMVAVAGVYWGQVAFILSDGTTKIYSDPFRIDVQVNAGVIS